MILNTTSNKQLDTLEMMHFDGKVIVRINKFVEEKETEGQTTYEYITSEYAIDEGTIESEIKENPLAYWEYKGVSMEERISAIEEAVLELALGGLD